LIRDRPLVRILYPSHISDEYAKRIAEYDVIRLPAAVFRHTRTGRVAVKVERDLFESLPNLRERVAFLISDIHRAIAAGHTITARRLAKQLKGSVSDQSITAEEAKNASGRTFVQLRSKNTFVVKEIRGDIVAGDKVQGKTDKR
jgi:hypothetical protein